MEHRALFCFFFNEMGIAFILNRIYLFLVDTAYLEDIMLTDSLKREIRMQTVSRDHYTCSHTGVLSNKQTLC